MTDNTAESFARVVGEALPGSSIVSCAGPSAFARVVVDNLVSLELREDQLQIQHVEGAEWMAASHLAVRAFGALVPWGDENDVHLVMPDRKVVFPQGEPQDKGDGISDQSSVEHLPSPSP